MAYIQKNSPFKQTKYGANEEMAQGAGEMVPELAKKSADDKLAGLGKAAGEAASKIKKSKKAPSAKRKPNLREVNVPTPKDRRPNMDAGAANALSAASRRPQKPSPAPLKQTKKGANATKGK